MNRTLKRLAAAIFVGMFATAIIMSCGQKTTEATESGDTEAKKDSTEHPAGEHPSDSTEHPTDTTKKN
jgi:hypothetical protein